MNLIREAGPPALGRRRDGVRMSDQPLQPHQKLTEHLRPGETRALAVPNGRANTAQSQSPVLLHWTARMCLMAGTRTVLPLFGAGYPEALPIAFQFGIAAIGIVWSLLVAGIAWKTVTGLRNMVYAITNRQIIVVPAHWPYPTAKAKLEEVGIPVVNLVCRTELSKDQGKELVLSKSDVHSLCELA